MARLGQAMLDVEISAGSLEEVAAKSTFSARIALISPGVHVLPEGSVKCVSLSGKHGVDLVGNGGGEGPEDTASDPARGPS